MENSIQTNKSKEFIRLCKKYDVDPEEIPEVLTVEDAFKIKQLDPTLLPNVSMLPERHQEALIAHYQLIIVAEALNTLNGKQWVPNWNNSNEWKYYPWFEIKASKKQPSGFGFSLTSYDYWYTRTTVGSRLCFRTRDLAIYAGKHFAPLFEKYFLLK